MLTAASQEPSVKWRNTDLGAAYYYITATFTEWLPLLNRQDIRLIICEEIARSLVECRGSLSAYVLMPDHLHLVVYLPEPGLLHRFNKLWRGRSARRITVLLEVQSDSATLELMARHANGGTRYAVWKEQVRALAIWNEPKLNAMVNYIHGNPVRRGLVEAPGEWRFSSWGHYEQGEHGLLEVVPPAL
jgi:REP element-mobilizing transposase RayT